jgi:hypothetical protein
LADASEAFDDAQPVVSDAPAQANTAPLSNNTPMRMPPVYLRGSAGASIDVYEELSPAKGSVFGAWAFCVASKAISGTGKPRGARELADRAPSRGKWRNGRRRMCGNPQSEL